MERRSRVRAGSKWAEEKKKLLIIRYWDREKGWNIIRLKDKKNIDRSDGSEVWVQ